MRIVYLFDSCLKVGNMVEVGQTQAENLFNSIIGRIFLFNNCHKTLHCFLSYHTPVGFRSETSVQFSATELKIDLCPYTFCPLAIVVNIGVFYAIGSNGLYE